MPPRAKQGLVTADPQQSRPWHRKTKHAQCLLHAFIVNLDGDTGKGIPIEVSWSPKVDSLCLDFVTSSATSLNQMRAHLTDQSERFVEDLGTAGCVTRKVPYPAAKSKPMVRGCDDCCQDSSWAGRLTFPPTFIPSTIEYSAGGGLGAA
jgi:hypothetical protein